LIAFQFPAWFLLFCVAAGLLYATLLYRKDTIYLQTIPVFKKLKGLLFALRALAVTFIAILLLSPLVKKESSETEKPIILIARDNSSSIAMKTDLASRNKMDADFEALKTELGTDYSVKSFTVGSQLKSGDTLNYKDKSTNLSDALVDLYNQYGNQNVGAIVLASDGIYNQGSNPVYTHGDWMLPFFTVALGDTALQHDAFIGKIYYNKICYLHDQTSIKVEINANFLAGLQSQAEVTEIINERSTTLFTKNISYTNNNYTTTFDFLMDAKTTGIHHYRINLPVVKGEMTAANNVQDIYIEVVDARQKVLLLANAPHPDLAALKTLIESNENYECNIVWEADLKLKELANYNLVILHQFPSVSTNAGAILNALNQQKIPILYVLGSRSSLPVFNRQQGLIQINGNAENTNEAVAAVNKNFNTFIVEPPLQNALEGFPPLLAPFGEYRVASNAAVLAYQKIGTANTKMPLLVFGEINGLKVGVLCGEGIWRWKIADYLQHQNFDASHELVTKIVQLLIAKNDKRKFKADPVKHLFYENETIDWEATLYNDNYEFINTPDVQLNIIDERGKNFTFIFNKTEKAYNLNAGFLPVGNYNFIAKTTFNKTDLVSKGSFAVQPLQLEGMQTTANHQLLHLLSQQSGGSMVYPSNIASIASQIKKSELIKPIIYTTHKTTPAINLKWIFFLLLILLSTEWFIRKYAGGY
jgi:hypothetical protein